MEQNKQKWDPDSRNVVFKEANSQAIFNCKNLLEVYETLNNFENDSSYSFAPRDYNNAIRKCGELGEYDACFDLFYDCKQHDLLNEAIFSMMIYICSLQRNEKSLRNSLEFVYQMLNHGYYPTNYTYCNLIQMCTKLREFSVGKMIWLNIDKYDGYKSQIEQLMNQLNEQGYKRYSQQVSPHYMKKILNKIDNFEKYRDNDDKDDIEQLQYDHENKNDDKNKLIKNEQLWHAGLDLYIKSGDLQGALKIFDQFSQYSGIKASNYTFSSLLKGISQKNSKLTKKYIHLAQDLFAQCMIETESMPNIVVFGNLIECYSVYNVHNNNNNNISNEKNNINCVYSAVILFDFLLNNYQIPSNVQFNKMTQNEQNYWHLLSEYSKRMKKKDDDNNGTYCLNVQCFGIIFKVICNNNKRLTCKKGWKLIEYYLAQMDRLSIEKNNIIFGSLFHLCSNKMFSDGNGSDIDRALIYFDQMINKENLHANGLELQNLLQTGLEYFEQNPNGTTMWPESSTAMNKTQFVKFMFEQYKRFQGSLSFHTRKLFQKHKVTVPKNFVN